MDPVTVRNMDNQQAQAILDKIIGQIFGYKNPFTLEKFMQKFAFDVRLPVQVNDSTTGETTWVQAASSRKYLKLEHIRKMEETDAFMLPKEPINSIEELLKHWEKINYTATERQIDSINVAESDNIRKSENVYRSIDCSGSKNILFSDGIFESEFLVGSQRSFGCNYCGKVDDSINCSNSFSVAWSNKIVNSFFISDCFDMYECMFCSHQASKRFCIANMQLEEVDYMKMKDIVIRWILS